MNYKTSHFKIFILPKCRLNQNNNCDIIIGLGVGQRQNSMKSRTYKYKIQVPREFNSKTIVFQVQIKYQKNPSIIQGFQENQVLLATL